MILDIYVFWNDVLKQNREKIKEYFADSAYINWHCTNESFDVDEFIRANCEYPGEWDGEVERIECFDDKIVTVVLVYPVDMSVSFHVTSFFRIRDDKIISLDEYWADDGIAPKWRRTMNIGKSIK